MIRSLEIAYANLMNMHSLLPELGFQDRAADIVNTCAISVLPSSACDYSATPSLPVFVCACLLSSLTRPHSTITSQIDREADKLQPSLDGSLKEANAALKAMAANPAAPNGAHLAHRLVHHT